jgi:hypothetical protein
MDVCSKISAAVNFTILENNSTNFENLQRTLSTLNQDEIVTCYQKNKDSVKDYTRESILPATARHGNVKLLKLLMDPKLGIYKDADAVTRQLWIQAAGNKQVEVVKYLFRSKLFGCRPRDSFFIAYMRGTSFLDL